MDNYRDFIDDLRFVYLEELHIGQKIEDMVTFFSSSPELSKREYTSYIFKLCCLCLVHMVPEFLKVSLGTPSENTLETDFVRCFEPLQSIYRAAVRIRIFIHVLHLFPHVWSCRLSSEIRCCDLHMTSG